MDITITQTKNIVGTLGKPDFIMKSINDKYSATISFPIVTTGEFTNERVVCKITSENWNTFWSLFNNGKFLVDTLKVQQNMSNLIIPNDIESWFVNVV